ncbi:hypothetical protein LJC72_10720 [Bacteroides sp. OttesenSCG-928-D19]|nr:hypothetical protein [Bacteroides sp. OttesenSCG-928-D19]
MKKKIYLYLSAVLMVAFASSCQHHQDMPDVLVKGVDVQSFEASCNFDLSARSNWDLSLGAEPYYFTVEGNRLIGTSPKDKPYHLPYEMENGNVQALLIPPNYWRKWSSSQKVPLIDDQSTPEKFMLCDPLRGPYTGKAEENITGIYFYHYNALLSFVVEDAPEGSKVFVEQMYDQKITPLPDANNPNAYKAIVFPHNKNVVIVVETGSKTYKTLLFNNPQTRDTMSYYPDGIGSSTVLTFTARINEEDELVVENINRKTWSKEWPVGQ